ncbi:multiple epidermal growth factor-like domains protein 11 [Mya arenaria]|uniref:multiple epidermal growth factor-like domains protein 11 n=1 Tax=Mya arenaria TaxID=6604 RepID=UPI0022E70611|nr:multiple epidermal growth factor-like domains protein 11 [Mya arenaria]
MANMGKIAKRIVTALRIKNVLQIQVFAPMNLCDPGFHGQNCSRNCHCYNDDDCNPVNGICKNKLCSSGWQGVTCGSQCGIRNFGQDCSYTCNCVNGTSCDPMNGLCSIPDCEKGWQGRNCSIGCDKQTFGYNCKHVCHCYECDDKDGSCGIYSCNSDWEGESCSQRIHTNEKQVESPNTGEGNTAVSVLSTLLVVSVIGHIVVVTIYCRRKARKSHAKEKKTEQNYYTVPAPSMSSDYATLDVTEMSNVPSERRYINVNDDL